MHYASRTDNELVEAYRAGDGRAADELLGRYWRLIDRVASRHFAPGMEHGDIVSFALMQLLSAMNTHRPDEYDFPSLAVTAVKRGVQNAVKAAGRGKHSPLNRSARFEAITEYVNGDDEEDITSYYLADEDADPALAVLRSLDVQYYREWIRDFRNELTEIEWIAITERALGYSYKEIATNAGVSHKTIDNAVRRASDKARRLPSPLSDEYQHADTRPVSGTLGMPVRLRAGRSRSVRDTDNRLAANRAAKRVAEGH